MRSAMLARSYTIGVHPVSGQLEGRFLLSDFCLPGLGRWRALQSGGGLHPGSWNGLDFFIYVYLHGGVLCALDTRSGIRYPFD